MAIRKDLDDMLNNLTNAKRSDESRKTTSEPSKKVYNSKIDNMSVDDLLSTLTTPKPAKEPKPNHKKKIVITGELPDYEALRAKEKAAEEAEKKRIEAEKKAAEESERKRIEAEKKAIEEAERKRIEAEKKTIEGAERKRIEAEKKAAEEAERKRIEAEKKAIEEAERKRIEAEKKAIEEAERKRIEAEKKAIEEAERKRIEAEKKAIEEAERKRVEAEKKATEEAANNAAEEIETAEEIFDNSVIETIRQDSENLESEPIESDFNNTAEEIFEGNSEEEEVPEKSDKKSGKKKKSAKSESSDEINENSESKEKNSGKLTSTLEKILDEDPEAIIERRSEKTESDNEKPKSGRLKKGFYAVFGVIFAALACIGLITVIAKGINMFDSYTSGDSKKEGFESVIYPAVIMDIESFNDPSELPSDQVITAAIWSMIMTDGVLENYEMTFDVVKIPAIDVESYAVKLFGDNLPPLTHTTVGPADNRFYYNEESKSYNVPVEPITFTYSPEIKSATKSGNDYTVTVDYIDERPEWLPKVSSKSVEFRLTETNGSYQIKGMKIISATTNAI